MGRNALLSPEAIDEIRVSYSQGITVKALAKSYQCSTMLIYRVLNKKGAYAVTPQILGTPVLDIHGVVINVTPVPTV